MAPEKRDWALTREAFAGLLEFLDSDPSRAAFEYEHIRQRLIKLFRWRGCLLFEEYVDQTMDRVARRIAEGVEIRTANPYALFYGVAMNVVREHFRKVERESHALNEHYGSRELPLNPEQVSTREEDEKQTQHRLSCIRLCLRALPSGSLTLIKKYYAEGDMLDKNQRKQIADALKISVNALRVRAFRIRSEVEKCTLRCIEQQRRG